MFEQTGEMVCERCGMSRRMTELRGFDLCVTDDDFASDGYPEPTGPHATFVYVTPPALPLILPMGVQLAEERAREMAVIADADAADERVMQEAGR